MRRRATRIWPWSVDRAKVSVMIGVRLGGEEIWLEPEEWENWVRDGRIPPGAPVLLAGDRWVPAGRLEAYQALLRREPVPEAPSRPLIGEVIFPGRDLSATEVLILVNILVTGVLILVLGSDYTLTVREWTTDWWHEVHEERKFLWWIPTMFMHAGAGHLLRNMVSLLAGAGAVEFLLGRRWTYTVYLATGLGGMWLSYAGHGRPPLSIGASGAVFGLVGCVAGFLIRRHAMFTYRQRWKTRRVYLPLFIVLFLPSLLNADYLGHVGGLLTGILMGFLIPPHPRIVELARVDRMREDEEARGPGRTPEPG